MVIGSGVKLESKILRSRDNNLSVRARGFDDRPITVTFIPVDDSWKVATQLALTDDPHVFTAPDLQYFMDSPTELSNFAERSWEVHSGGKTQTIRLVVHHDGNDEDVDIFLEKAKKIVDAQIDVFSELPDFDYGTYTFIADYLPYVSGDGMEHRNSTILTHTKSLNQADFSQLAPCHMNSFMPGMPNESGRIGSNHSTSSRRTCRSISGSWKDLRPITERWR